VLVIFAKDITVVPKESAWFGSEAGPLDDEPDMLFNDLLDSVWDDTHDLTEHDSSLHEDDFADVDYRDVNEQHADRDDDVDDEDYFVLGDNWFHAGVDADPWQDCSDAEKEDLRRRSQEVYHAFLAEFAAYSDSFEPEEASGSFAVLRLNADNMPLLENTPSDWEITRTSTNKLDASALDVKAPITRDDMFTCNSAPSLKAGLPSPVPTLSVEPASSAGDVLSAAQASPLRADRNGRMPGSAPTIVPMRLQPLYVHDWIGLRTLDERGAVHLESCDEPHMHLPDECWVWLVEKYVGGSV
jgi:hypothetical protein